VNGPDPSDEGFVARCERAVDDLLSLAATAVPDRDKARLHGKAEGVRLALSYLRDYPVAAAVPEPEAARADGAKAIAAALIGAAVAECNFDACDVCPCDYHSGFADGANEAVEALHGVGATADEIRAKYALAAAASPVPGEPDAAEMEWRVVDGNGVEVIRADEDGARGFADHYPLASPQYRTVGPWLPAPAPQEGQG